VSKSHSESLPIDKLIENLPPIPLGKNHSLDEPREHMTPRTAFGKYLGFHYSPPSEVHSDATFDSKGDEGGSEVPSTVSPPSSQRLGSSPIAQHHFPNLDLPATTNITLCKIEPECPSPNRKASYEVDMMLPFRCHSGPPISRTPAKYSTAAADYPASTPVSPAHGRKFSDVDFSDILSEEIVNDVNENRNYEEIVNKRGKGLTTLISRDSEIRVTVIE